ncbi:MAG: protein kinase [Planctomycetes bacterium]|nr:protein kinase [Planctomycetota bacterium]
MGFRNRQRLGQYRIVRRLAVGGFAQVYRARDTVEGIDVALKIPHEHLVTRGVLNDFRKEAQLTAPLDHPNILPIKTAGEIEGHFVIVTRLGDETLGDRLGRRLANKKKLVYAGQLLEALSFAHKRRIIHCDLKPENLILFPEGRLRLADFGIAKVARKTLKGSGSGTVGYMAPEQALGQPSARSDVFAAGLIIWRMLSGRLPEWPFEWPYVGTERVRRTWSPELLNLIRRALAVDTRKRFSSAEAMLARFEDLRADALIDDPSAPTQHRKAV